MSFCLSSLCAAPVFLTSSNSPGAFESGEQTIEYFLNHSKTLEPEPLPDILILDVKLPGCSGFDVLERLQLLRSRPTTIAMFTTSILLEDKQQAETLGADLFQTKTFEPAEFSRFAKA